MLRKVEVILCLAVLGAMIFRIFLISGSSLFGAAMLITLAFIYFYLGFLLFTGVSFKSMFRRESYKGIARARTAGAIFSGFALSLACIGLLFKILSWPGSAVMLGLGLVPCAIILVICFVKINGKYAEYYKPIALRMIVSCFCCAFLLFFPQKPHLEFMERDNPSYIRAVEAMWNDPGNRDLRERFREECKKKHNH